MNYLSVESISKSFSDNNLFRNITFGVSQGQKVALVGINGSGKSTLLKIIMGEEKPDEGKLSFRNDIKISWLSQNPPFGENDTVISYIFSSDSEELRTLKEYELLLAKPATEEKHHQKLTALIEKMDLLKLWDYESQVKQILGKLGIYDLEQKVQNLSGGQKKRVAMARALIEKPDFLILDEPTNHLDLEIIEWLENYLANQQLTLLLVTHDRYFLEKITNEILELDAQKIFRYKGNYSYFLEKKAERQEQEASEVEKAKNLMRKELDWIRRQPQARGTKAKYRIDAFEDLKDKASKKVGRQDMELNVQTTRLGGKILEVEHVSKSFGDKKIIEDFSYVFKKKDRIGIIGKNGSGKTTLLNMITGKLQPDEGTLISGSTTVFGYYTQDELTFKEDQRVIDIVKEVAEVIQLGDGSVITASQFLQHFQFPPSTQYNPVGKLSGGERRRLQLLRVLIKNPNFLILDEPTNDLDIMTLNILEEFLFNFSGCLILVSHDRYFMDRLVDHLFVFEGEGKLKDFPGNYSDYREIVQEQEDAKQKVQEKQTLKTQGKVETTDKKRKLSYVEKKEYEKLETEIAGLEEKKTELIDKLNSGTGNHEDLHKWSLMVDEMNKEIDRRTDRWLELSEFV